MLLLALSIEGGIVVDNLLMRFIICINMLDTITITIYNIIIQIIQDTVV